MEIMESSEHDMYDTVQMYTKNVTVVPTVLYEMLKNLELQ